MTLAVGDPFPTVAVQSPQGPVDLSRRWARGPLVVAFRRLWCPFCQESVNQLESVRKEFSDLGADVVVIYRGGAEEVTQRCQERAVGFDCLSDPDSALEKAAGLSGFRLTRYAAFAPTKLVRAFRAGGRIGKVNTGILQGRGTYVVDRDGRVRYIHISANAADIPPVEQIVAAVRAAA